MRDPFPFWQIYARYHYPFRINIHVPAISIPQLRNGPSEKPFGKSSKYALGETLLAKRFRRDPLENLFASPPRSVGGATATEIAVAAKYRLTPCSDMFTITTPPARKGM